MVIIFEGRRVNSFFEGKTHQIQLNNTPKLHFFFWITNPLTTQIHEFYVITKSEIEFILLT